MSGSELRPLLAGVHRRAGPDVVIVSALREIRVGGDAALAEEVLGHCDGRRTAAQIAAAVAPADRADAAALIDDLAARGALVDCREAWRILHAQSSAGSAFTPRSDPVELERLASGRHIPDHARDPRHPLQPAPTALAPLLARRRSAEPADAPRPVTFGELSALLAAAYGPTRGGHAPVASGGGLYPLLLHVVIQSPVDPAAPGIWWYDHEAGDLCAVAPGPVRAASLLVPQDLTDELAGRGGPMVVVSAAIARQGGKYGNRAYRFALLEAGSAWQNLALAAAELDVPARPVGGVADGEMAAALRLGDAQPLLAVLLGA